MEKKTRLYITAALVLLFFLVGAILGFKVGGAKRPAITPRSGLNNKQIKELERGIEEGSSRSLNGIEGVIGAAGDIEEGEKRKLEELGHAAERARNLKDGLGRIREDAAGIGEGLEDIGGILEELQRRAKGKEY